MLLQAKLAGFPLRISSFYKASSYDVAKTIDSGSILLNSEKETPSEESEGDGRITIQLRIS